MKHIGLIVLLVWGQLRHERYAAACLCIAIAAALIPLLMILGLKEGVVNTLRSRLSADPVNLEIVLPASRTYRLADIEAVAAQPGVGFCVARPRHLAAAVDLLSESGKKSRVNLMPTGNGDPLLARFRCAIPAHTELVVSSSTAKELQVNAGDFVSLQAGRYKNGRMHHSALRCRVIGILPQESMSGVICYVPLSTAVAVEEYMEGARAGLDKAAGGVEPTAVYHGIWVDNPAALQEIRDTSWSVSCPFKDSPQLLTADMAEAPWLTEGCELWSNCAQFVVRDKLRRCYSQAKIRGVRLFCWNPALDVSYVAPDGSLVQTRVNCRPELLDFSRSENAPLEVAASDASLPESLILQLDENCKVPVSIRRDETVPPGQLLAGAGTLGKLYQARWRGLSWDAEQGGLVQVNRNYSGMRLYAATLDDVEKLAASLKANGHEVRANEEGIARVRILNEQLGKIFGGIALISIAGAVCSLALSLYNSALKRSRDYAILSTMGLSRYHLAVCPLCEAVFLTSISVATAFAVFHLLAWGISLLFAEEMLDGESLCYLSPFLHLVIPVSGVIIGLLSAVAASCTVLRVQPSTAIREL